MSRIYAGVLGTLAMAVVLCRGAMNSGGAEATFVSAATNLALFAIVGAIVGHIAQSTIDESVRTNLEQQLTDFATGGEAGKSAA